jgi:molecular chaperone DnaJ
MTGKRDYYEVLGVARDAALQEIKSAYRKLAVRFHPDRNPGDAAAEESFKEAAEAYAVLSDAEKRARYDRFGHRATGGPAAGGFDPTVFADFSDILGDLFGFGDAFGGGRRRGRSPAQSGADLRYDLRIEFEEAVFGKEVTLRIPRLESCETCDGSGSASGKPPVPCATCGGRGQVRFSQGFFTVARTCPQCRGEGAIVVEPCPDCRGAGRVEQERTLQLRIPPGVDTGARLRLTGEGEHGRAGGPSGDLYVVIEVEDHERYLRRGADVLTVETISFSEAVLGATLEVETLHGPDKVRLPAGTQYGHQVALRGKGIPHLGRSSHGDHVVEIAIDVPEPSELSETELDLIRQLAELRVDGRDRGRRERNVFARVKERLFG